VVLPVTSTLTAGQRFEIHNNSTGSVTVQSSGLNTVATVLANTTTVCTCILTSGTSAASWDADAQGFTTSLPVAQGGTGATTLTSNNVLLGAGTSTVTFVAPGSSGNVLTSDGSTWTSAAAGGGSFQSQLFTSPGTWTKPAGATQVRIQIIGGGGNASGTTPLGVSGQGGSGGYAYVTNIPVSGPVAVTVGSAPGGTSSFGSAVSCTGGGNGSTSGQVTPILGSAGTATVSSGTALRAVPGTSYYDTLNQAQRVTSSFNGNVTAGAYSATGSGGAGLSGITANGGGVGGAVIVEFVG
jgi:hypothetical protein